MRLLRPLSPWFILVAALVLAGMPAMAQPTQAEQVAERLRTETPPGGSVEYDYAGGDERVVIRAVIVDGRGRTLAAHDFNPAGEIWRSETWDPETGQRSGGFENPNIRYATAPAASTPARTDRTTALAEGALVIPAAYGTLPGLGDCQTCQTKAARYSDLAAAYNARLVVLKGLARDHDAASADDRAAIRARFEIVGEALAMLKADVDVALTEALVCVCPASNSVAARGTGAATPPTMAVATGVRPPPPGSTVMTAPAPPPPVAVAASAPPPRPPPPARLPVDLVRPSLGAGEFAALPARFCSEVERNSFMTGRYNPAAAQSKADAEAAVAYLSKVSRLARDTMATDFRVAALLREEYSAYKPITDRAIARSERMLPIYGQILAVPIGGC